MIRTAIALAVFALLGCASAGGGPTGVSPQQLQQECQRNGGWWHPEVGAGYCERV